MDKQEQSVFEKISFLEKELAKKNRELEIEAGLEIIRSRSLAMHNSEELKNVIAVMFEKLSELNVLHGTVAIHLLDQKTGNANFWIGTTLQNPEMVNLPYDEKLISEDTYLKDSFQSITEGKSIINKEYAKEQKDKFFDYVFSNNNMISVPEPSREIIRQSESQIVCLLPEKNSALFVDSFDGSFYKDEELKVLERAAKVFEQAYTRFLDLQKAEAQARGAQIEAALERVRAKTMAMQSPSEFVDVINVIGEQFIHLGFDFDWVNFSANGLEVSKAIDIWNFVVVPGLYQGATRLVIPFFEHPVFKKAGESVNEYHTSGNSYTVVLLDKKDKDSFLDHLFTNTIYKDLPQEAKTSQYNREVYQTSNVVLKDTWLSVGKYDATPLTDEQIAILKRLANEFGQAYTRFLDLQKAEAQAREAQIQLALERVRAKSLAMYHSSELQEVVNIVAQQLHNMNIDMNGGVFICINKEVEKDTPLWAAAGAADYVQKVIVPDAEIPIIRRLSDAIKKGNSFLKEEFSNKEKKEFFRHLFKHEPWNLLPEERKKELLTKEGGYTRSAVVMQYTSIAMINHNGKRFSVEENEILKRFGNVFEQSYTRFLDLQKAETQAREAQIQLALERVRARTMAMQKSDDLKNIVAIVLEQFQQLGFVMEGGAAHIGIFNDSAKEYIQWSAEPLVKSVDSYKIPYNDHPLFADVLKAKKSGEDFFYKKYSFEEKNEWFDWAFSHSDFRRLPNEFKTMLKECNSYAHWTAFEKNSAITINNILDKTLSPDQINILKRFAEVFEQSYTRFLDLQKAEAQAREAQIEASLERVRGKAMAMHNSNDVSAAASMVFTELRKLGIDPIRCGVGLLNKETVKAQLYSATSSAGGDSLSLVGWVQLENHPVLEKIYESWIQQKDYYPELTGEQLESYYKNLPTVPNFQAGEKQYGHFFPFSVGCLYAWSDRHYNESEIKILKRFATIIDLTFRRFLDLQKAEAQAKEAQIETALEKVRSRTLAMQKSDELADTSAVLFKQLIHLGIAPNRLYIGIIHDNSGEIEFWITDEDGSKVSLKFTGNALNNPSIKKMYDGWAEQKKWQVIDMHGKELTEYFHYLGEELRVPFKGGLSQKRRIQYLAYFSKGFIGMASPDEQPGETVNLLERFAYVFNLTFTRFNDLQIAEAHALQAEQDLIEIKAARKRAEDTLTELQETQKQLIQSEKMASLGELTAGIAHEIQNPLNFVNNFSEVSNELVDEMNEELNKGEIQEAKLIASDIKQNLEKINQHGKRADAIVKGMLQHSRKSSGQKEPTDINALADEYLRLSYHGLRAKDKNFNATIETDFDNSIGKINIIPQDIGRVLLNLFNNAFYAVNEQKSKNLISYEPKVFVRTQKCDDKIQITVRDNGNGIPQKIVDKIFQPFFTTKPTGQGTGLGLSLSYDIVKAHGGRIKVESKEGEGSEFIIQLSN